MTAVLDASALLALLKDESGADIVAAIPQPVIASVNLTEVVTHFARHGAEPDDVRRVLKAADVAVIPQSAAVAFEAGMLVKVTSQFGLSLGDRSCLALGKSLAAPVYTTDRIWQEVARLAGVEVILIR